MKELDLDDPVAGLLQLDPASGKIELTPDGYESYIPSEDEAASLGATYAEELRRAKEDHKPFFQKIQKNIEAYRGIAQPIGGAENPVITLPIVGREIDQIVAWEVTTTMAADPLVSIDPLMPAEYDVLAQMPDPMSGAMGAAAVKKSAEDVARAWELGMDYHLRQKQEFRKYASAIFKDIHIASMAITKIVRDASYRTVSVPKIEKTPEGWVRVVGKDDKKVANGAKTKILRISPFSFMMPLDENDVQEARWISEDIPMSTTELRSKLSSGEYSLVDPDDWEKLLGMTTDQWMTDAERSVRQNVDRRFPKALAKRHDVKEVWFNHPVKIQEIGEDGKKRSYYQTLSLCGHFHMDFGRFLVIYRNPYNHGLRPYEVTFEDEESGRFSSESTAGRTARHQSLISTGLHLEFQNQVAANNFNWWAEPGTETWDTLVASPNKPGRLIPGKEGEDFGTVRGGENRTGLLGIVQYLKNDLSETSGVSQYEMGADIPNRTPANTVSQIMQAGYLKPIMHLAAFSDSISKIVRLYLETLKQYEPFGESLPPALDPETGDLLEIAMRYPVDVVIDNFRIALTAADEQLAKERTMDQFLMLNQVIAQNNQAFAQMAGAMRNPQASPALTEFFDELLTAQRESLKMAIEITRRDSKKFLPSKEAIESLKIEKEQELMMQQQQMMMQQGMGGMGGGNPQAMEGTPNGPANGPGGMEGAGAEPGVSGVPQGASQPPA